MVSHASVTCRLCPLCMSPVPVTLVHTPAPWYLLVWEGPDKVFKWMPTWSMQLTAGIPSMLHMKGPSLITSTHPHPDYHRLQYRHRQLAWLDMVSWSWHTCVGAKGRDERRFAAVLGHCNKFVSPPPLQKALLIVAGWKD